MARDSILLWLGIIMGVVLYLSGNKPITQWDYYQWLAALGYLISVISAKLGNSPLQSKAEQAKDQSTIDLAAKDVQK